jgi:hypothetical protein
MDTKKYLEYLDKEMTIMGILSAVCVAAPAGILNAVLSKDSDVKSMFWNPGHFFIVIGFGALHSGRADVLQGEVEFGLVLRPDMLGRGVGRQEDRLRQSCANGFGKPTRGKHGGPTVGGSHF